MSILNVNKINPVGGGSTITIAGIASVTNAVSVGNSVTAGSFVGPIEGNVTGNVTGDATGLSGNPSINTTGIVTATAFIPTTGQLSHRNKIINGAMTVSQYNASSVVTGVNATGYRIDRWTHQMASVNSAFSVSQSTDSPDGFANSYKIDVTTADTSLSAAHAHFFRQKIEGQNLQDFAKGTSSAKQFALSFYVKTNKTGVYTVEMYDIDNNRAISKTFTVADSNWNRYIIIFPADTTGAFDNNNGNSLVVQFFLSAGSNYTNNGTFNNSAWGSLSGKSRVSSSNVNFADSTSNNWYLTGVQLEVGSVATPFEHRSFGDELARCQRYFYRHGDLAAAIVGTTRNYALMGNGMIGHNGSTDTGKIEVVAPVRMRQQPTVSVIGTDSFIIHTGGGETGTSDMIGTLGSGGLWTAASSDINFWIDFGRTSGGSPNRGVACIVYANNNGANLGFSAEL